MFIPIGTDRPPKHPPIAAPLFIGLNIAVAILVGTGAVKGPDGISLVEWGWLWREDFHWVNLFTSTFLHDPNSIWHLVGNMIFLWVFGCAVEGRLGSLAFAAFYLAAGAAAGAAHLLASDAPAIGASGAIAGVVGAFLAFSPRAQIRVLGFIPIIGVYSIPSVWLVGLYFVIDLVHLSWETMGRHVGRVAYAAHLGGYLFGFAVGFALLGLKILPRDEFDAFFLFRQWQRRAEMRAAARESRRGLWIAPPAAATETKTAAKQALAIADDPRMQAVLEVRRRIDACIRQQDRHGAAAAYLELVRLEPGSTLPEERQLEVANELYSEGHWQAAADAYEAFLGAYRVSRHRDEVGILLALLYVRKLSRAERALPLLEGLRTRQLDPSHAALRDQLITEAIPHPAP